MVGGRRERAKRTDDTLLDILPKIKSRSSDGFTYLTGDEIEQLKQLEEQAALGQYVADGILSEDHVFCDLRTRNYHQLDCQKLEGSIKTILTLNRLIYDSPEWEAKSEDIKVAEAHIRKADKLQDRVDYLTGLGDFDSAVQLMAQTASEMQADFGNIHQRYVENAPEYEKYDESIKSTVALMLAQEESKYPRVNLFGNYIPDASLSSINPRFSRQERCAGAQFIDACLAFVKSVFESS